MIPPILLVRLKPRLPGGERVAESRRVCHLVPVPDSAQVPEVLRAYCGTEIPPGGANLLDGLSGMPCEPCLAKSPIPTFAMLRTVPFGAGDDAARWWDLGLRPEQRIAARFVLLLLMQDPARPLSVAEIALWLGQDPHTINLIMLLHTSVGWVQRSDGQDDLAWADRSYRLTPTGASLGRQALARRMTPTFTSLAARLGLDATVITEPATPDPGGCSAPPSAAPTGPNHGAQDAPRGHNDEDEEGPWPRW